MKIARQQFILLFFMATFVAVFASADSRSGVLSNSDKVIALSFDRGWKVLPYNKNKRTLFTPTGSILKIESIQAVAFYYYRLPRLSQISHCDWWLHLDWRVLNASQVSSQRTDQGDDRPLAVHLWLNEPARYGWFKGNLARLFGVPTPGRMLSFTWGLDSERGMQFPNPHAPEQAFIRVVRGESEIGKHWLSERIPIDDEIRIFGDAIRYRHLYLVISADTEDSGGSALAEVRNLRLLAESCAPE